MRPCTTLDPVLRQVLPIRAALDRGRRLTRDTAAGGRSQELQRAVKADDVHGAPDVAHPGDGPVYPRRVTGARNRIELGEDLHIPGVGTRQVSRKRGLGAAGPRDRRHRHATHHTDEKDQHQIPAPPAAKTGPEPVARLPHHACAHPLAPPTRPAAASFDAQVAASQVWPSHAANPRQLARRTCLVLAPLAREPGVPAASSPARRGQTGCPPTSHQP